MDRLICPEPDRDLAVEPLGYKSSGASVEQVQRWLNLDVNGYYGKRVERTVAHFQSEFGLVVDGIVGPITYAKLCEVHEPQPAPDDPVPYPDPDPPAEPKPDYVSWGIVGIGLAFLIAMFASWATASPAAAQKFAIEETKKAPVYVYCNDKESFEKIFQIDAKHGVHASNALFHMLISAGVCVGGREPVMVRVVELIRKVTTSGSGVFMFSRAQKVSDGTDIYVAIRQKTWPKFFHQAT